MRKRADLVELEKTLQDEPLVKNFIANVGFEPAENGPSKVWFTGIPVDRYTGILIRAPSAPVYPKLSS